MPPLERATLNQAELDKLTASYKRAMKRIIGEFETATDFGQARRAEQLAQINGILTQLGVETADWIDATLPSQYERGTTDAIGQLTRLNVGLKETSTMSAIDRRAVAALSSETQEAFATSLTTVGRSANKALSDAAKEAIRQEIAEGRVLGSTRKQVSNAIIATMKSEGITALIDKGGVEWKLDRYAEMLARTKMVEARNTGLANKMVANGYDLVQVSNYASKHSACARWEGKIISLTGKTPGYKTMADAMGDGLFHPNCRHQINAVNKDYSSITKAYDPTTKTYHKPFAGNPPAAKPAGKINVPKAVANAPITVPGGSFAGQPVVNGKVSFKAGKQTFEYAVNKVEADFVERTALRMTTLRNPFAGRISRNTRAYYTPKTHSLHLKTMDAKTGHTFYHELGHAIDYKFADSRISTAADTIKAMKADAVNILAYRLQHMYGKYTIEQMTELVKTRRLAVEGGHLTFDRAYRKYAASGEEVFADAYAQYRKSPAAFAKYAPNVYAIFKELIK